jgi:hypothetical protein
MLFKYGACPSERGAAGTTAQEVKQSALGALGVLLGALPIGDLLDLAIGSTAESSGLITRVAESCVTGGGESFTPGTKVLPASGLAVVPSEVWTVPASVDTRLSCPIRRESEKWVRHAAHIRRSTRRSR